MIYKNLRFKNTHLQKHNMQFQKITEYLKYLKLLGLKKKKKTCFLISTTKKNKLSYFITPFRESQKTVYCGVVVFNNATAKKIASYIDGQVDYVFVDIEKKISHIDDKLVNIERSVKEVINMSIIKNYKPNDITVNALENFIQDYFAADLTGVGRKKILIVGAGNIGSKIGLRLLESGGEVFMTRRDNKKLNNIVKTLNLLKPKATVARCHSIRSNKLIFENYDVIIGCADNTVKFMKIKNLNNKPLVIDVGKGVFSKSSIKDLNSQKISIFRLDIENALNATIDSYIKTENFFKNSYIKNIGKHNLIKKGILGTKGDIVVDDVEKPKRVIGLCGNDGLLQNISFKKLKILHKNITKKNKL